MPVAAVLFGDAEDRDSAGEGWWRSSCSCLCCCCCLLIGIQRQEQQPPPGRNQKEELGTSFEQLSSGVVRACLVCLITSTIEPRTQPQAQFSNIFYRNGREERRGRKKRQKKDQKSPTTQSFFVTTNIVPLPPPPPPAPAPPLLSLMLFSFWSPFFTNYPKNILSPHLLFTPTTTTFVKLICLSYHLSELSRSPLLKIVHQINWNCLLSVSGGHVWSRTSLPRYWICLRLFE